LANAASGSSSRVPVPPPRTSTPPRGPGGQITTVQPVPGSARVACPTANPSGNECSHADSIRRGSHARATTAASRPAPVDDPAAGIRVHRCSASVVWDHVGMDGADSHENVQLPIACTLGPDDGAARMQRWEAVSTKARLSARHSGHLLEVRYQPAPGIREESHALVAAERNCCSFAQRELSDNEDAVVLRIMVHPERQDDIVAIAGLFRAD
jgi:hypothetical protein